MVSCADLEALEGGIVLEFVCVPEARLVARHAREALADREGPRLSDGGAAQIRGRALRETNIVVGVSGDHVPAGKDFALDVELRPLAASRAGEEGTTSRQPAAAGADVRRVRIRVGHVRLIQLEVIRRGAKLSAEELELRAGFPALCAGGRGELVWIYECLVRAETLGVIAVEAQPLPRPPQQAKARRQRLSGQRRGGLQLDRRFTRCNGLMDVLISRPSQQKEVIRQLDLVLQIEAGGVLREGPLIWVARALRGLDAERERSGQKVAPRTWVYAI